MFADAKQLYYDLIWMQEQLPLPTQAEIEQMYADSLEMSVISEGFNKEKDREENNEEEPTQEIVEQMFIEADRRFEELKANYPEEPFPKAYYEAKK